jgi:hypothetical protein
MRSKKSFRVAAACISSAAVLLLACSESDTIAALNVSTSDHVPLLSRLHVHFAQGSKTLDKDFDMLPTRTIDNAAGAPDTTATSKAFYERIKLDSFSEGSATVDVEAFTSSGSYQHPMPVEFKVRDHGVTAVYVKIVAPEDAPPPMEGTGGSGGTTATGGNGGNGGTDANGGNGGANGGATASGGSSGNGTAAGAGGDGGSS